LFQSVALFHPERPLKPTEERRKAELAADGVRDYFKIIDPLDGAFEEMSC
jgi:hypothetical protein